MNARNPMVMPGVLSLLMAVPAGTLADDWPQWRGPQRDGVWRETELVETFEAPQLDIVWRQKIGSGYSGPTVADGRVYVTDRVREPKQIEHVHCFDAATGKPIWSHAYDCDYRDVQYEAGPRASVLVNDGLAYSLGTMGHLFCFDAATGDIRWHHDLNEKYRIRMPMWGIAASPVIEGDLLIVQIGGEDGACLVALDRKTGEHRWKALDDNASYSAPHVITQAGQRVLVCWTGERVVGLDPQTGSLHWEHPFPPARMIIGVADPVVSDGHVFITEFFSGSLLLKLAEDRLAVEKVWARRGENEVDSDALHTIIATPYIDGDHVYGVDGYGQLRCLKLSNGDRVWEDTSAVPPARWATIHLVRNGEKTWMFNERGELIIARLTPAGYEEMDRARLIAPTRDQLNQRDGVCWSHPAFASRHVFARNDEEIVCASLATN